MSRHVIPSPNPRIEIVVGWDPPLRTLFAQVADRSITGEDADPMLLWDDFATVDHLARAIAPWAELPADIRQVLAVECGEAPTSPRERAPAFERSERVVFAGTRCRIVQAVYPHGGIALQLFEDNSDRTPHATATVCIPEAGIRAGQALIKDYEENAGMLEALVAAGIVRPTGRRVKSGFVEVHVVDVVPAATDRDG